MSINQLQKAYDALRHTVLYEDDEAPPLSGDELNFVSSAKNAVLSQSPKGAKTLLRIVLAFFVVFFLWAAFTTVDEFTRGDGKVIPSQQIQIIQNLEGGILAERFVSEGEIVERGQPLVRLDDTRFSSSLREAGVTLSQLQIKSHRLRAEAENIPFKIPEDTKWEQRLVNQERAFYDSRQREFQGNRQVLEQQLSQKKQELSELTAKKEQVEKSFELLETELELTRPLVSEGAVSEVELLRLERQLNDLSGELEAAKLALPRVESSLIEAEEKLRNVTLVFRREAREQMNEITLELSRLTETSEALVDRVKRTVVKSPVTGTVKRLLVNTIGGVIQPGMDIAEIVPSEETLLIEAKIRPSDIAYLHPGQEAKVKFTAYDFSVMGGLDGKVVHISPDTIMDEQNESFYLVRVETSRVFTGPDGTELPIIPGMTVSVDVLTGEKTVLDYLLKPILKTKQLALRER